jgi:quercetin dioxygenase-like cupin family protein
MRGSLIAVALLALAVGFGLGAALGQQSPATANKGVDAKVVSTIDLAPDMPGHQLRLRTIAVEPGGVGAVHSYKERPAFAYIVEGALMEMREDGDKEELSRGGVITQSRDVTHWSEHKGSQRIVLVGVNIIKP